MITYLVSILIVLVEGIIINLSVNCAITNMLFITLIYLYSSL